MNKLEQEITEKYYKNCKQLSDFKIQIFEETMNKLKHKIIFTAEEGKTTGYFYLPTKKMKKTELFPFIYNKLPNINIKLDGVFIDCDGGNCCV